MLAPPDRECRGCHSIKPATEFYRQGQRYRSRCKLCIDAENRAWFVKNRSKQRNYSRQWSSENKSKQKQSRARRHAYCIYHSTKTRAHREGVPFAITKEDIQGLLDANPNCPVFGTPMQRSSALHAGPLGDSPTLDRFIPRLGYVRGNVFLISWRANRIKCDATTDEVRKLLRWMTSVEASRKAVEYPSVV